MSRSIQTLDEMLDDPMIQLVMARDGWRGAEVRLLMERARSANDETDVPPAHVIARECLASWACR